MYSHYLNYSQVPLEISLSPSQPFSMTAWTLSNVSDLQKGQIFNTFNKRASDDSSSQLISTVVDLQKMIQSMRLNCVTDPLVHLEEAEVMFARVLQGEIASGHSLELGAFLQEQEARNLARLQEVELFKTCGWSGAVSLHALKRGTLRDSHFQLHILTLLLTEMHLKQKS